MGAHAGWPFDDPPNVAVITTRPIIEGTSRILSVSHDEDDGSWQFLGPEGPVEDLATVVALSGILQRDSSIAELADLPVGWRAWRDSPGSPWQRAPRGD